MKKILFLVAIVLSAHSLSAQVKINAEDVRQHLGKKVIVTGKIIGGKSIEKNKKTATVLKMAGIGANPSVSIVINSNHRKNFPYNPNEFFINKRVSVTGKLTETNGKPEMVVTGPEDIKVEDLQGGEIRPMEFEGFNRFFQ